MLGEWVGAGEYTFHVSAGMRAVGCGRGARLGCAEEGATACGTDDALGHKVGCLLAAGALGGARFLQAVVAVFSHHMSRGSIDSSGHMPMQAIGNKAYRFMSLIPGGTCNDIGYVTVHGHYQQGIIQ